MPLRSRTGFVIPSETFCASLAALILLPTPEPDGICNPVRNVLCFPLRQQLAQNVSSGVTNPAAL